MTQGGFLRFATRPWKNERKEEQPPRLTMAEAQAKLAEFTAADGHVFLPDDAPFTELGMRSMQGHRQWTDAYLLHLARKPHVKPRHTKLPGAVRGEVSGRYRVLFDVAGGAVVVYRVLHRKDAYQ